MPQTATKDLTKRDVSALVNAIADFYTAMGDTELPKPIERNLAKHSHDLLTTLRVLHAILPR